MGKIKLIPAAERKVIAVLGETKQGFYVPLLHPINGSHSVYVGASGVAQLNSQTIQGLSELKTFTPIYEGDQIILQF